MKHELIKLNDGWALKTDDPYCSICRYCGEKLISGYFCPMDKQVGCISCKKKDNNYRHVIKDIKHSEHEHYRVIIMNSEVSL